MKLNTSKILALSLLCSGCPSLKFERLPSEYRNDSPLSLIGDLDDSWNRDALEYRQLLDKLAREPLSREEEQHLENLLDRLTE